ncbi:MAG: DUF2085 domain-containing protein [Chloroflexota bacterium]|nr:DUF2085 domain-containing protein [Chloroflexota bacterium]
MSASEGHEPANRLDDEVTSSVDSRAPVDSTSSDRASYIGDRIVLGIARHWLAFFNIAIFTYLIIPFLAPLLMQVGASGPARLIYTVYSPACHQLPDRSYFLFGEKPVYSLSELEESGVLESSNILLRRKYVGDETLGWKVALCERDLAIYGAVVLAGLLFGLIRDRFRVPKLSFKFFLILLFPIAFDGLSQLFGFRSSNWMLRTITGALFGFATVWLAYPYIDESMAEIRESTEKKLARRAQLLAENE